LLKFNYFVEQAQMKTILITGASSGIGRATAIRFQAAGWNVAATMRNPERETELQQLDRVAVFPLEVTDPNSINILPEYHCLS
jgi:NAD(P)-dependent dehydrogenase (short-subunit alcohol dehydrogenase family)